MTTVAASSRGAALVLNLQSIRASRNSGNEGQPTGIAVKQLIEKTEKRIKTCLYKTRRRNFKQKEVHHESIC